MKSDYKMTTVYEYARLLDNDLTTGEKSVKKPLKDTCTERSKLKKMLIFWNGC